MRLLFLLAACKNPTSTDGPDPLPELDVSERLMPGQVRAGVVGDEAALFGGISAEGQIGDFKIYNDQVQFIVQSMREGSYYLELGGGVIDADRVRPEGEIGRDYVEELSVMLGFGRVVEPSSIEVIENGSDGSAMIRVVGHDVPMSLLVGVLESATLVQSQGLDVITEYRLRPDSPLLEVTTTITATQNLGPIAIGDILFGAPELAQAWTAGSGLSVGSGSKDATGYIGAQNDGAVGMLAPAGEQLQASATADLLLGVVDLVLGFGETAPINTGESRTFTRYWGAAADFATLTDARLADTPTQSASGTVTAPDGTVEGARVHILVDDQPYTVAVSGADGSFSAEVPMGSNVQFVTDGAGRGLFFDLPDGSPAWPAFSVPSITSQTADALQNGSPGVPLVQGRGIVEGLELGEPGTVRILLDDDLPFSVRIGPAIPFPDRRFAVGRPDGQAAAGWSRGETLDLLVEPGTWDVTLTRGIRFGVHQEQVTVAPGQVVEVQASLPPAFEHPGYLWGDPHSHAAPSGDGRISMEERLIVHAAGGVQLHFGSDHDRVADYRPLVDALELDGTVQSIVSDEVSSVLRGHMNAYPLEPIPSMPNNGAVSWWTDVPETTQEIVDRVRERHGEVIVQSNHPLDTGVPASAGWSPGNIGSGSFWVTDLNAMEVLNDGQWTDYYQVWLDVTARGYLMAPVGVSDAHGHFSGPAGVNGTWIGTGSAVGALTDDQLRTAYRTGDVHVGLGVFLELSEPPGSTFTGPTTLQVTARSADYAAVDRILLYENGQIIETVPGNTATFTFDAPADAIYVVSAEGDQPMQPVSNRRPWATSGFYLFDRGADGWVAPLAPLTID